jgi:hypothetical protein
MKFDPAKERSRLTLPATNGGPDKPPPAPAPPAAPAKKPASDIREFQLLDGRPIALVRSTVSFATPHKDEPDTAVIVGLRNARAVPIRASYTSFLQWWLR